MKETREETKNKSYLCQIEISYIHDQRGQFLSVVREYEDIFAKNNSELGKSDLLEHEILTGDCQSLKQPPRRVPSVRDKLPVNNCYR